MPHILLLDPANFMPSARTPWGGTRIVPRKSSFGVRARPPVGEAWELSVDPARPSHVHGTGEALLDVILREPAAYLGLEAGPAGEPSRGTALLLKWLDAGERLSLQIHPRSDDPALGPSESGKPESWYVVERDEGAGIFFGLRDGVTREDVAAKARAGGEGFEALLEFVPVEPGDFFVVDAGTPHAIDKGVLVVEPQLVTPGRTGVTYRFSDWNRRYGQDGQLDPAGAFRPLQVADALRVLNDANRGAAWVASRRVRAGLPEVTGPAVLLPLSGPGSPIPDAPLHAWRLAGDGALALPRPGTLVGITVLEGSVVLTGPDGARVVVPQGQTAAVPAGFAHVAAELLSAHAIAAAVSAPAVP